MTTTTAEDITATLVARNEEPGWNWADQARTAWLAAAEEAGLVIEDEIQEPADGRYDNFVTRVQSAGQWYTVSVRLGDDIRAELDD